MSAALAAPTANGAALRYRERAKEFSIDKIPRSSSPSPYNLLTIM
jgi:hypothetical protein